MFLRCLEKDQTDDFLFQFHAGPAGGNFLGDMTAHKVMRVGYYWPTLFRDSHSFVRKCEPCQKCACKVKKPAYPLQPVAAQFPFQQWGLDFVRPINPVSSLQHKYILTSTDYFTRWVKEIPLRLCNTKQVIPFLENKIITRFGTADYLVFDNASYFQSIDLTIYALEKGIKLKFSTNYYPQDNGLAESSNKNLISILKKIVASHHKNWHTQLYG